jgi:hypothetical protein
MAAHRMASDMVIRGKVMVGTWSFIYVRVGSSATVRSSSSFVPSAWSS